MKIVRFITRSLRLLLSSITELSAKIFAIGIAVVIIGIAGVALIVYEYSKDLPDYSQLANYNPPTVTRLYASDGRLLAEYAEEKRIFVPLSAVPKRLSQAFISAEDKNFYKHKGVDLSGIVRAMLTNIRNIGQDRGLVGGSTITQQVVKNFLLTNEKSIERKIKEAILAMRISKVYSKDKILELYLNEIFLGNRSYGIAAAALNYFDKALEKLTLEEVALLAAMPKAPSYYNPYKNIDQAKIRRDWILERMYEDGYIREEELKEAQAAPITLRRRSRDEVIDAGFFAEEVRQKIAGMYGEEALYRDGMVVKTTIAPELQMYADTALRDTLIQFDRRKGYRGSVTQLSSFEGWKKKLIEMKQAADYLLPMQQLAVVTELKNDRALIALADGQEGHIPMKFLPWTRRVLPGGVLGEEIKKPADVLAVRDVVIVGLPNDKEVQKLSKKEAMNAWDLQQVPEVNGALVALDPFTGRILAMSGGYMYGKSKFNRATQAMRQPGSAFKPFVYLAALENGYTPSTVLHDAPIELEQGPGLPLWRPKNYGGDYLGPVTLRVGLEKSRNLITVRLAQLIGIEKIIEVGQRFGIYNEMKRQYSAVLGAEETTLLRLVSAYAAIANGGKKVAPAYIERIDNQHGKVIYRRDTRECSACTIEVNATLPSAPPELPDMRERIVDPRLAYQMTSLLQGVVQRGTATRANALSKPLAGKTGTTNDSVDTWFIGYSPDLVVGVYIGYDQPKPLGSKATGSSLALPAYISFMEHALSDKPATPFKIPRGIRLARVDLYSGLPAGQLIYTDTQPSIMQGYYDEDGNFHPNPVHPRNIIQEAYVMGGPLFSPAMSEQEWAEDMENSVSSALPWHDNGVTTLPEPQDPYALQPSARMRARPSEQPVANIGAMSAPSRYRELPAPRYDTRIPNRNPQRYNPEQVEGTGGLY